MLMIGKEANRVRRTFRRVTQTTTAAARCMIAQGLSHPPLTVFKDTLCS